MNIITGTGRSGTSLVAKVLYDVGYNVGAEDYDTTEPPYAGMEAADVNRVNMAIIEDLLARGEPFPSAETASELAEEYADVMHEIEAGFPKDPRFARTVRVWHRIKSINFALVCVRDLHTVVQSAYASETIRYSEGSFEDDVALKAAELGYLIAGLEADNVSYSIVGFPQLAQDWKVLWNAIAPYVPLGSQKHFIEAYQAVVDRNLIHYD